MAWIELHERFIDHFKTKRLAASLNISIAEARSIRICLWLWTVGAAPNGNLNRFSQDEIADGCRIGELKTKIDAKKLFRALIDASILDEKDSKILVHDWKKHGIRILEQSRKRVAKSRRDKDLEGKPVALPIRDGSALLSLFLSSLSIPSVQLNTPEFRKAWTEWVEYRREKRKALNERTALRQLLWISKQQNAVMIIENSIRNGWQGLFPLEGNSNGSSSSTNRPGGARQEFTPQDVADRAGQG